MASLREQIVQSRVAALEAASVGGFTAPAGLTVHRFRTRSIQADDLPALAVYLHQEPVEDGAGGYKARRRLTLRVECRALGTAPTTDDPAGVPPDAALDPLVTWVERALLADPRCGGLAHRSHVTGVQWTAADSDELYAAAAVDVVIDYVTKATDPEST